MIKKDEKSYSIDCYKKFLTSLINEEYISKELLDQINKFYKNGCVFIEGNNLFGKIIGKGKTDYLEIKYENGFFNCSYTCFNTRKIVNLIIRFTSNNIKMQRKEVNETFCSDGLNETQAFELERIYTSKWKIIFESIITNNYDCMLSGKQIYYNDRSDFLNKLCIDKKWFFSNGSIVYYKLIKPFLANESEIKEIYSICVKPYINGYTKICDLEELDESLFKQLMLNKISIEEVIDANKKINEQKIRKLNSPND